jgi:ubiquitin carboxyl-terminal hydrolase 3
MLSTATYFAFSCSYICDEFVMNDTLDNVLEELRQELKDDAISDGISETSSTLEEVSSSKSTTIGSTTSSSSDSGWEEPPLIGRKLRPRKRTISSDNTSDTTQAQSPQQKTAQVTPPSKRNKLKKVVGLRNLGNTCFMNSVLQSLSNIREFSCYFNKLPSLETTKLQQKQKTYHSRSMKENLDDVFVVEELRKVLLNLSQGGDGTKGAISPECLFLVIWRVVPQFRGHRQHDAHEFLRYMLDRLHTELQQVSYLPTDLNAATLPGSPASATATAKATGTTASSAGTTTTSSIFNLSPSISHLNKTQRNSIVTNVFGGTLQSEVRCLVCGMESKKHDPFLDLSLDIPEKFYKDGAGDEGGTNNKGSGGAATTGCDNSKPKKPTCHISDCLSSFTEVSLSLYCCLKWCH